MSALVDAVATLVPIVDPRLSGSILSCANTPIPMEVALAMTDVIKAVADQMEKEGRVFRGLPISCIFTGSDSFTTRLDENQCAICVKLAVYPLPRLLPHRSTFRLYTALAEELCHLIWDIADETLINFKVLEVLRNLRPEVTLADLYSEAAVAECAQYAQDHPESGLSSLLPG